MGDSMNYLVRKPDAGKPHVRFDERGVETESMASYSGTSNRKGWSPLRLRLNFTAPLLDSTTWISLTCARAAALNQPVTPPIFITSGITRSDACASMACSMSNVPHQFSPH